MTRKSPSHGFFEGRFWHKTIDKSRGHMLWKPPSIALDKADVGAAIECGIERIVVFEKHEKKRYEATLQTLLTKGIGIDRGHGEQIALLLTDWATDEEPTAVPTKSPPRGAPGASRHTEPVQLALLEVVP